MVDQELPLPKDLLPQEDPIAHFGQWYDLAQNCGLIEPAAMSLATAGADGTPQVRVVLLRGFADDGFCFYTNTTSTKGGDLAANPRAALCFHWQPLGRQIRVNGAALPVADDVADEYFASRHPGSQVAAWASRQSQTLPDRDTLMARVDKMAERFADGPVTRPPFWSGYRVVPQSIEFWQHEDNRLHQRLLYNRTETGWRTEFLYP